MDMEPHIIAMETGSSLSLVLLRVLIGNHTTSSTMLATCSGTSRSPAATSCSTSTHLPSCAGAAACATWGTTTAATTSSLHRFVSTSESS
jgi:hypothetical protein